MMPGASDASVGGRPREGRQSSPSSVSLSSADGCCSSSIGGAESSRSLSSSSSSSTSSSSSLSYTSLRSPHSEFRFRVDVDDEGIPWLPFKGDERRRRRRVVWRWGKRRMEKGCELMELHPPSYAMAPMYADHAAYRDGTFYNQQQWSQPPPAMQMVYSDFVDDETAAYEAMYSNQGETQQYVPSQELNTAIIHNPMSVRIQEVLVGLEQLIADPEDFDSWANAIKERFVMMDAEQRTLCMRIVMEMLISSVPLESGAPVSGAPNPGPVLARLVSVVANEVEGAMMDSVLPILQKFHKERVQYGGNERAALLKFYADCFERLDTRTGTRIQELGKAVVEHTMEMLKPNDMHDERMRAILQTVKLAGPGLDSSADTRPLNDELLTQLAAFGKGHPKLSEGMRTEIAALIETRENGWGSRQLHAVNSAAHLASGVFPSSSSTSSAPAGAIIGADGRPLSLSEEERHFLEEHFGEGDDDEMFAEMDKFVREGQLKGGRPSTVEGVAAAVAQLTVCEESKEEEAGEEVRKKEEKEEDGGKTEEHKAQ